MLAIEGKLGIARHQSHALGDGVRDNDVVAGIVVLVGLIELQPGIGIAHVATDGQELDVEFFLNRSEYFGGVLEISVEQFLVVEMYYQFAH